LKYNRTALAAAGIGLATAMILTGCGPSAPTPKASNSASSTAVITVNGSEPQNPLIPTNTNEVGGGKILDAMFAGLVYYDEKGAPHNDVADSITTKDNTTYTIKIKPGLKFTNDEPITSKSFVDAWQYGAKLSNAQLSSYFFEDIEGFSYDADTDLTGLKIVDDTTFTVTLTSALADFPLRLGYSAFYPLPESAWKDLKAFGENPIGNGPYMFASPTAWQHNVQIELKDNPAYNGPRKAKNGGLTIKFYANQDAAYADLQGNNLDVLDAIPTSAFGTFQKDLGDRAVNQPAAIFQSFTIPDRLAHFGGQEGILRRQALSMAINRQEITKVIFQDTRTPASDFTSPVIDGWSNKLKGADVLKFNEKKAKDLWAQADKISPWTGTFQIAYNADGGHQGWVDAVTNSIKNVLGIDSSGAPYPTFKEARTLITNRTIQTAFRTGWQADYPGLFNFLGPLYGTKAGSNDGDYSNKDFDALLKKGSSETDLDAANKDFQQAQEILLKDLPAIPLWYSNVTGGFGTDVQNVHFGWNSVPLYYEITKKG
jgi:oligopeptide transport system substrate-binding protein